MNCLQRLFHRHGGKWTYEKREDLAVIGGYRCRECGKWEEVPMP